MIEKIQRNLLLFFVFLFPLVFLPLTQDFYSTTKFYFLVFVIIILLFLSVASFISKKVISIPRSSFYGALFTFVLALVCGLLIVTPNKLEALVTPQSGVITFISLSILAFYISQQKLYKKALEMVFYSSGLLSLITLLFFLNPLARSQLPPNLQFLQDSSFSPIGNQLDLAVYLGFALIFGITYLVSKSRKSEGDVPAKSVSANKMIPVLIVTVVIIGGILCASYRLIASPNKSDTRLQEVFLPPMSVSWSAAVETLKKPQTAIFGVGSGNFQSAFTRAKVASYNQGENWNLNFNRSASGLLEVWTSTGLLGLTALLLIFLVVLKYSSSQKNKPNFALTLYTLLAFIFLPISLPILFLLFLLIAHVRPDKEAGEVRFSFETKEKELVAFALSGITFLLITLIFVYLARVYESELYFKKSLDGLARNQAQNGYTNMQKAIAISPYIERYHIAFSQLNLLIASSVLTNATSKTDSKNPQIEEKDRSTITQAIQQAISQAKLAVNLNPQKASNWENLGIVYSNVIGIAAGADRWALSAYGQAIAADSANPALALAAGSVYYRVGEYAQARDMFARSVRLKSDFANGYYNLGWAFHQEGDNRSSIAALEQVLKLVEPGSVDYKKAEGDLKKFREASKAQESTETPGQEELNLPKPAPTISPKIELNEEEATPPAAIVTGAEEKGKFDLSGTPSPTPTP